MADNSESDNSYQLDHTMRIPTQKIRRMSTDDSSSEGTFSIVILSGPEAGQIFPLTGECYIIGRDISADISLSDLGVSRHHAAIRNASDGIYIRDTDSANGTFVNGRFVDQEQKLEDGDKIAVGTSTVLEFAYQDEIERNFYQKLREESIYDHLTGAHTRKHLFDQLETEIAFAKRQSLPLSVVMYDLDHFKQINDTYGHPLGDEVLKKITSIVGSCIRKEDVLTRYGGEEFAIICRQTPLADAKQMAERMRAAVAEASFDAEGSVFSVTISVGVAALPEAECRTPKELLSAVDAALYKAKENGRNQVCADWE